MQQTVPVRRPLTLLARLRGLLGLDAAGVRQSLVALFLNSSTSFVAGAFLGSITGTLEPVPGPARAGAGGDRAAGQHLRRVRQPHLHRDPRRYVPALGPPRHGARPERAWPSASSRWPSASVLAVVAKAIAVGLGVPNTIALLDHGDDLDHRWRARLGGGARGDDDGSPPGPSATAGTSTTSTAPLVSTLGDVLTLPALYLATFFIGRGGRLQRPRRRAGAGQRSSCCVVGLRSPASTSCAAWCASRCPCCWWPAAVSAMAGIALEKRFALVRGVPRAAGPRAAAAVERRRARRDPVGPAVARSCSSVCSTRRRRRAAPPART